MYIHVNQKTINYVYDTTNRHLPRHYRITRPNQYHRFKLNVDRQNTISKFNYTIKIKNHD
jgi:hypothetical protein